MEFNSMMKGIAKRAGVVAVFFLAACFFLALFAYLGGSPNSGVFVVVALGFFGVACAFGYSLLVFFKKTRVQHQILVLVARERDEDKLVQSLYGLDMRHGAVRGVLYSLARHDLLIAYKAYVYKEYRRLQQTLHGLEERALDADHVAEYGTRLKAIEKLSIFRLPPDESSISNRPNEINQDLIAAMNARKG